MTDWAALLNPEQLEAVTAPDGPVLVLAAAGTGKTRTLTHRVAWLMEQGVDPRDILLLTFTNRAAREMLERAEALVGPAIGTLWSGTFHHVCHRILRQNAREAGRTPSFTILDRADALSLLNRALKEVVADTRHFPKKEVLASLIGKAANTEGNLRQLAENIAFEEAVDPDKVLEVAGRYAALKEAANALDFDDLLTFTLRLFREHPETLARYAHRFRHVLVDEYQDTNTIQAQLVDALASHHRNLMAVGDDFQCIYSWRGADFRNIMGFPERWPGCRIVKLERNYRSAPEILAIANATIANNPEQFQKTLLPTLPPAGRKPLVAFLRDAAEQNQMVIRHIQRALQSGYRPEDIAVLYRAHFHAMELELDLRRLRVPYTLTSGQGLFESAHVKDAVAFLRLCSGQADFFSLQRVLGLLPGIGPKTAERIWAQLGGTFDPARETDRLGLAARIPKKAQDDWHALDGLLARYRDEGLAENGNRAVTLFCLDNGLFTGDDIDTERLEQEMGNIRISFRLNPETGRPDTYLNGVNVENRIRSMEVSAHVSPVAALPFVRQALVAQQQQMGREKGIVMDGRDIGTTVFPDAELKVFVTASPEIRAQRRYDELKAKGQPADYEDILANVKQRDDIDQHRAVSPLRRADDALLLDNSHLTIAEQKAWLIEQYRRACGLS